MWVRIRFFIALQFSILFISCFSKTEEEALLIYKNQLENIHWIDLNSGSKIIFDKGNYSIIANDSSKFSGKYELKIKPNHGLIGKWEVPIKKIKFFNSKKITSSYKLEKPLFTEKILTLKKYKKNEFLILSKDLNLAEIDSVQFKIIKELNYKFTSIDSIIKI